jgi:hypothetical protein
MAVDQLEAEAFWHSLAPDLAIQPGAAPPGPVLEPNEAGTIAIRGIFDREGYIRLPSTQDPAQIGRLARLVTAIRDAGLPPVFAFVFEEMWRPFWRIGRIVDALLGGQHAIMPDLWAWHVDPAKGEAGWSPHRDRSADSLYPDLRPKAATVWIPLTEATPLNGCMYVVPKYLDPDYTINAPNTFRGTPADIRAVPATPGDTLIWTQTLIHWGARTSVMAPAPRLSMSVEFQRADLPAFSGFYMTARQLLTFEQKLALIGYAIIKYQHMQPLGPELTALAGRWRNRIPELFGQRREATA